MPSFSLFCRDQVPPALGHPVPHDFTLKVAGEACHVPAFVGVLLELLSDVHLLCLQDERITDNAQLCVGFPTMSKFLAGEVLW